MIDLNLFLNRFYAYRIRVPILKYVIYLQSPKPDSMQPIKFILVAEDDLDDQQLLQTVFREKKYFTPLRFVNNGIN